MRLKSLVFFLLAGTALSQQLPPVPISPPNTTGVQVMTSLPANWYGAGAAYNPAGSPKVTGWASYAHLMVASQALYTYTTYDILFNKGNIPTTSTRTGLATVVRTFGPSFFVLGFGTAGVSQTTTAVQGTFSGGGMLIYKLPKSWTFGAGYRAVSGSAAGRILEWGFGKTWAN